MGENSRKNHARAMDSMQASLESEQRAKAEALRIKKKLEGDINELEIALDHASDKRAVESAVHTMHAEIDDMLQQAKNSEEKAKKAMVDAARLADELRAEQDHTNTQSKA